MRQINIADRNDKELKRFLREMNTLAKKHPPTAEIELSIHKDEYTITIEAFCQLGDYMAEIVGKSKIATVLSNSEHEGHYDWGSDTYFKSYSEVVFRL